MKPFCPRALLALATLLFHAAGSCATPPANFVSTTSGQLAQASVLLDRYDIQGAQVIYTWKQLEPQAGRYDFSPIERDLALTQAKGKKLFIQIQDRFFSPEARYLPAYLLEDPQYDGGLAAQIDQPGEGKPSQQGWVAMQWNAALRQRYQALLEALAAVFDGRVYGVNLPETAIDVAPGSAKGYTCDAYFSAELENAAYARRAFKRSQVVLYVNFWPCEWNNDQGYMERTFRFAVVHDLGLGGPDVVPNHPAHMKNAYPYFHRYRGRLPLVATAIQAPTLTYLNPETQHPYTREEFQAFARDYLGANIIFWTVEAPWLKAASGD